MYPTRTKSRVKLGVLVCNNNQREETLQLLRSLRKTKGEFEVFLLDNGCSPAQDIRLEMDQLKLVVRYTCVEEAMTYSAGFNLLMKQAKVAECDYVWLLHQVISVESTILEQMVVVARDKRVAVVGCGWEQEKQLMVAGGKFVDWLCLILRNKKNNTRVESVDWVDRECLMMVTTRAGWDLFELDTSYYEGFEIIDLTWRLAQAGFKSKVIQNALATSSGGAKSYLSAYFAGRNRFLFIVKRLRSWTRLSAALVQCLVWSPLELVRMLIEGGNGQKMAMYWQGWGDGVRMVLESRARDAKYPSRTS